MISCRGVTVSLGNKVILSDVDLDVSSGQWLCVVGPNGAGKSTLLRYLAGIVVGVGDLTLDGRPAGRLGRRERALSVALVPQTPVLPVGIRVLDYVLLGRAPHIRALSVEGPRDLAAVREALVYLDLLTMADRAVSTLSGGERQRVLLARALAQQAPILLLDEPTTALDVGHQQQVLELVEQLRMERNLTVVSTMHDLTLAGLYADRLVLLDSGRVVVDGSASEVLTEENVWRYYGAKVMIIENGDRPAVMPLRERPPAPLV